MPCRKKEIRDIVYEYVFFTPIEELIIEDCLFQRLRFVFQNSCAYLTYPSNQLTRFSHSLGVMHLGGDLFKNGISNSSKEDYYEFLNSSHDLIKNVIFNNDNNKFEIFISNWNIEMGNVGEFPSRIQVDGKLKFTEELYQFLLNYIWQALRIACLIHDIGHFPFSHIFEMGIDSFEKRNDPLPSENPINAFKETLIQELPITKEKIDEAGATKLHEFFGAFILKQFSKQFENSEEGYPHYFFKCLEFAERVFLIDRDTHIDLYSESDPQQIILCLHTIISSDIDADRLDYVLRDSMSSGINFGNFDFERITLNSKIFGYNLEDQHGSKKVFGFFITDKALSSIEQFFNHRYLLYQHLYFHHNVSKYDGILIESIAILLELAIIQKNEIVLKILNEYRFISEGKVFLPLDHIENYDDSWLRTLFQDIYRKSDLINDDTLRFLLETFLFRKKQNTYSFVKKSSEVDDFLKRIYSLNDEQKEVVDNKLHDLKTQYFAANLRDREAWVKLDYVKYIFSTHFKSDIKSKFLANVKKKLLDMELVFIHKDTPPKIADKKSTMLKGNNQVPITSLSKYLKSFETMGVFSFKHYFGIVGDNIKANKSLIQKAEETLLECLNFALVECIDIEHTIIKKRNDSNKIKD